MRLIGTLLEINALHTGQTLDRIRKDTERDYYMTSDEAKEYGIIDEVVQPLALATAGR